MDLSFNDLVAWSQTVQGIFFSRVFLVFLAGEVSGFYVYKLLGLWDLSAKKKEIASDLVGYLNNITLGFVMAFILRDSDDHGLSFINGLWFIVGSLGMHIIYKEFLYKYFKRKSKGK